MDTLFTTFLSPGMAPSWPLQGTTLLENCLVDLTNWSSNKNETMEYHSNVFSGDKGLLFREGCSDCCKQVNGMYVESPFKMGFQKHPNRCETSPSGCKSELSISMFNEYFRRQLHHKSVNRRMQTSLQPNLNSSCLQFGMSDLCQVEKDNHSCKIEDSKTTSSESIKTTETCPCDKKEKGNRHCHIHDLLIHDMEISEESCMWTVYFNAAALKEPDNSDQFFVNPCYDELCENLLDDSFEIEFSTTEDEMDTVDFTNIHFGGTCEELFDVYDEDVGTYDEDEYCEIFNAGLIISSRWNSDIVISPKGEEKKEFTYTGKKISKYHAKCMNCNAVALGGNSYRTESGNTEDNKLKKKVHFPEPDRLVTVHPLVAWAHAYKESRKSMWSIVAQDRAHFRRRIMKLSEIIEPVLKRKLSQFDGNT